MIDTAFGGFGEDGGDAPRRGGAGSGGPGGASRTAAPPAPGTRAHGGRAPAAARRDGRERTRAALLAAARRLWAERGIHGASLDEVAAAAGLTKGAVYSNFAGKSGLVLTLLERCADDGFGVEACADLRDAGRPADERLERAARAYARRLSGEHARLLTLLLVEFWLHGMRDQAAGRRLADWYAERRARLAEHLTDAEGVGPHERAALAVALDAGLALQHLLDPERVPADLYATGMRLVLGPALA